MSVLSASYLTTKQLESVAQVLHTLGLEMPTDHHTLMDGRLHVYRRPNSRFWQCATFLGSRNHRASTKQETLVEAKEFARGWYMERYADERRRQRGELSGIPELPANAVGTDPSEARKRRTPKGPKGPTFREAAERFEAEYRVLSQGERNAEYVDGKFLSINKHLMPFFGDKALTEITAGLIQDYRVHRMTSTVNKAGETVRPARATIHGEMVALRQTLKTANRLGWIDALPDMSAPYKASGKVSHRAWFSPEEYKILYTATGERARNPKNERWRGESEQFHDYVLFMANTGLRPDEASHLQFRDVKIVKDENHGGEKILEIEVRGKRGVGYCKSMPGAVHPFQRLQKRKGGQPTDPVFGKVQRELLNAVLEELNLKYDRDGQIRTAYSLRHTYISLRLMEGADIYQIAKNCRTSVEMIEKYYASHIKNRLDTTTINVRRKNNVPPAVRAARKKKAPAEG